MKSAFLCFGSVPSRVARTTNWPAPAMRNCCKTGASFMHRTSLPMAAGSSMQRPGFCVCPSAGNGWGTDCRRWSRLWIASWPVPGSRRSARMKLQGLSWAKPCARKRPEAFRNNKMPPRSGRRSFSVWKKVSEPACAHHPDNLVSLLQDRGCDRAGALCAASQDLVDLGLLTHQARHLG